MHTIKPLDEDLVVEAAKETGKVVTVEEHSVIGGLGSAVCDVLCEKLPTSVLKIGVNDVFGESGPVVMFSWKNTDWMVRVCTNRSRTSCNQNRCEYMGKQGAGVFSPLFCVKIEVMNGKHG